MNPKQLDTQMTSANLADPRPTDPDASGFDRVEAPMDIADARLTGGIVRVNGQYVPLEAFNSEDPAAKAKYDALLVATKELEVEMIIDPTSPKNFRGCELPRGQFHTGLRVHYTIQHEESVLVVNKLAVLSRFARSAVGQPKVRELHDFEAAEVSTELSLKELLEDRVGDPAYERWRGECHTLLVWHEDIFYEFLAPSRRNPMDRLIQEKLECKRSLNIGIRDWDGEEFSYGPFRLAFNSRAGIGHTSIWGFNDSRDCASFCVAFTGSPLFAEDQVAVFLPADPLKTSDRLAFCKGGPVQVTPLALTLEDLAQVMNAAWPRCEGLNYIQVQTLGRDFELPDNPPDTALVTLVSQLLREESMVRITTRNFDRDRGASCYGFSVHGDLMFGHDILEMTFDRFHSNSLVLTEIAEYSEDFGKYEDVHVAVFRRRIGPDGFGEITTELSYEDLERIYRENYFESFDTSFVEVRLLFGSYRFPVSLGMQGTQTIDRALMNRLHDEKELTLILPLSPTSDNVQYLGFQATPDGLNAIDESNRGSYRALLRCKKGIVCAATVVPFEETLVSLPKEPIIVVERSGATKREGGEGFAELVSPELAGFLSVDLRQSRVLRGNRLVLPVEDTNSSPELLEHDWVRLSLSRGGERGWGAFAEEYDRLLPHFSVYLMNRLLILVLADLAKQNLIEWPENCLSVGAGTGDFSRSLKGFSPLLIERGLSPFRVTNLDPASEMIRRCPEEDLTIESTLLEANLQPRAYQLVECSSLHRVSKPGKMVETVESLASTLTHRGLLVLQAQGRLFTPEGWELAAQCGLRPLFPINTQLEINREYLDLFNRRLRAKAGRALATTPVAIFEKVEETLPSSRQAVQFFCLPDQGPTVRHIKALLSHLAKSAGDAETEAAAREFAGVVEEAVSEGYLSRKEVQKLLVRYLSTLLVRRDFASIRRGSDSYLELERLIQEGLTVWNAERDSTIYRFFEWGLEMLRARK